MEIVTCSKCGNQHPIYITIQRKKNKMPCGNPSYLCNKDCTIQFLQEMNWTEYSLNCTNPDEIVKILNDINKLKKG